MRNIKRITTQDELTREITDTELEIERARLGIRNNWTALKDEMRPANLVRSILTRPFAHSNNGTTRSELPAMAAKMAAGFLINRWMVKKSFGVAKMTAGMLLQSGLAALLSRWTSRKNKPLKQIKTAAENNG